jgi:hypothetical protein
MKNLILIFAFCFVFILTAEEKQEDLLVQYKLKKEGISLCCGQLHRKTGKKGKNVSFQISVDRAKFGKNPCVSLIQEKDGNFATRIELDGPLDKKEELKTSFARITSLEKELKNWTLTIYIKKKDAFNELKWNLQELFDEAKAKGKKTIYPLGNPNKK